jgi:hypothetical protein
LEVFFKWKTVQHHAVVLNYRMEAGSQVKMIKFKPQVSITHKDQRNGIEHKREHVT